MLFFFNSVLDKKCESISVKKKVLLDTFVTLCHTLRICRIMMQLLTRFGTAAEEFHYDKTRA